jgi:hypothetical protein
MSEQKVTVINQEFESHKQMLIMTMKRQAGSISKAIMEAVQNSIDAAATEVRIKFTPTELTVEDNGNGFNSIEDIQKYFNVFGQPHEQNDGAIYGYYRMGRGQIFAFLPTVWRTHTFGMSVDIEKNGTKWDLSAGHPFQNGCLFSGKFYNRLEDYDYNWQCRALVELIEYSETPVYLNDKLITRSPSYLRDQGFWDYVDNDVYIKKGDISSTELKVYNIGMMVRSYHAKSHGMSGTIVSRKRLEVNMARNDIQVNECEVWKRITTVIKQLVGSDLSNKKHLNKIEKDFLAARFVVGEVSFQDVLNSPIFTDIAGRNVSIKKLLTMSDITFCPESQKRDGEFISNLGVNVFSTDVLERFACSSGEEFLGILGQLSKSTYTSDQLSNILVIPFNDVNSIIDKSSNILNDTLLDKKELLVLKVLRDFNELIVARMARYLGSYHAPQQRTLIPYRAANSEMLTDGSSVIKVNIKLLSDAYSSRHAAHKIILVLIHEYLHDGDDEGNHLHDLNFYENYHNIVIDHAIVDLCLSFSKEIARQLKLQRSKNKVTEKQTA